MATTASAETRYLAFDAADRVTQALTRGVTIEADRGLFGGILARRIISTSQRGSASITPGGPDDVRRALPGDAGNTTTYAIAAEGDGRGLGRALCPGSDEAWLAVSRVRLARPLVMHAVGRWSDGSFRHCVRLSYNWRGEWALPAGSYVTPDAPLSPATR